MNETIILTPQKPCKCSCREHLGSDGNKYWVDIRTKIVYSTDCHHANPIEVKGQNFKIIEPKMPMRNRRLRRI